MRKNTQQPFQILNKEIQRKSLEQEAKDLQINEMQQGNLVSHPQNTSTSEQPNSTIQYTIDPKVIQSGSSSLVAQFGMMSQRNLSDRRELPGSASRIDASIIQDNKP